MIEIYRCIKREEYKQVSPTRIETLNTEKEELEPNRNLKYRKPKHPTQQHNKTQEDINNEELIKIIMTENKTTLTSLRKQD